jgi:NADH:ubiquinone reductase (H+-translocating)
VLPAVKRPPRVVILGAGFGGLAAAHALGRAPVHVTVVDKRNHHLFQPLLYQVATAGLSATDIAAPIRRVLRHQDNTTVLLARAESIDPGRKRVLLSDGSLRYDHLILAVGATNAYFGHDEWEAHAPGLKSLEEALEIRRRVLLAYEAAEREHDAEHRKPWLTFVVIGGGATGVELAGALAEIAQRTMARNFRNFDPSAARVILLEGGERLLPTMPEDLAARAKSDLEELGVDVRLGTRAENIDAEGVDLSGERIEARTVLWAAGVGGVPIARTLGADVDRAGRVRVDRNLRVEGCPGVYAIGDIAACEQDDGTLVPGVAPAAIQEGAHAAANILRSIRGESLQPFVYVDKGTMATIGRSRAVAVAGKLRLTGLLAWLAWLFVHLMALVGFRNRVIVLLEWAWAYLSYQRSARIILGRAVGGRASPASERLPPIVDPSATRPEAAPGRPRKKKKRPAAEPRPAPGE